MTTVHSISEVHRFAGMRVFPKYGLLQYSRAYCEFLRNVAGSQVRDNLVQH